ncbi:probable indole-3-pyruvate monooxygenase YUCCA10 [Typha angustifolia]|uniref:probable indole-3-pyruvate monooxygenase YUCCA10 n=1 Tax=Typha angustifolia TaxID=59011 RepID=UPI003C2F4B12
MEDIVLIIGAGPSGLAVAACLFLLSIPFVILEKEDCTASLWKKRAYNRLKLHLAKQFCELPHMPFPSNTPTYLPKDAFIRYMDAYASRFGINPIYDMHVESASYDEREEVWRTTARNTKTSEMSQYFGRFLVVATGENSVGYIPDIPGLDTFPGEVLHSSEYKSGLAYTGKSILVVGCGNSGMEIAYDLSSYATKTSISIRSPLHIVTKEMIYLGMVLLKYLPVYIVDFIVLILSKFKFGDLSQYGIVRPDKGPFMLKATTGRTAVIDVGTVEKIKAGDIQVEPSVLSINGNDIMFSNGTTHYFDVIVFATGYKSLANNWLKDDGHLLNEEGLPKERFPNHWKGKNGVYCAGLSKQGLAGISMDAKNIANDIAEMILRERRITK